ncbi:hypothetical protein C8Q70DRAFT_429745 [Cubamyces menziesii]|nr:hypothetical protein C8Q70DRAFT_429745 [Cubamyces menziesii]
MRCQFPSREVETSGLYKWRARSGPRLLLRPGAVPLTGMGMGVAGAAAETWPDEYHPGSFMDDTVHDTDGDGAGGILSFRMILRNSSRVRENARRESRPRRAPDDERDIDESPSRSLLRLRGSEYSSSMLGLSCHRASSSRVSSSETGCSRSGLTTIGREGEDFLRRIVLSRERSFGVAGLSGGLRERDRDWKRGRATRPRAPWCSNSESLELGWMASTESCVVVESEDELEVVRRMAFVSEDKLGCVGRGCRGGRSVCKRGCWMGTSDVCRCAARDLLRLDVRTADVERLADRAARDDER